MADGLLKHILEEIGKRRDFEPGQRVKIYKGKKRWWKTPEYTAVRRKRKTEVYEGYYDDLQGGIFRRRKPDYTITDPGPCFVATAVYGDPMHPSVQAIRWYRENVLREHRAGRLFITVYRITGPILAKVVGGREEFQDLLKEKVLDPIATRIKEKYQDRMTPPLETRV